MTHTAFVRPAWTPVTIAMMIVGFMLFWPLGLAMLAYILWGDRLEQFKSNVNRATDRAGQSFSGSWGRGCGHKRHGRHDYHSRTGNVAFDEWRDAGAAPTAPPRLLALRFRRHEPLSVTRHPLSVCVARIRLPAYGSRFTDYGSRLTDNG